MKRVLISNISSYKAIIVAKFLQYAYPGIRIITCDHRQFTVRFHTKYSDKHYLLDSSPKDDELYIKALSSIMDKEDVRILIPCNNKEMDAIINYRLLFNASYEDYWGTNESFYLLNRKNQLYKLASKLRVKTPLTYTDLDEAVFPFVAKPSDASSAQGVYYLFSERDKQQLHAVDQSNYIYQQFIAGEGVGYSVFAKNGVLQTGYGHRRLAEYPVSGGSSVYRTSYDHPEMRTIAARIVKATDWSGFAMFEFKLTRDHELYLIEVNPRIWGSIYQGLCNGVNYFETLLGRSHTIKHQACDTYLSPLIYYCLFAYLMQGNINKPYRFLRQKFRSKPDVSFLQDPRGYMSILLLILERLWQR